ncbi:MAG: hypothetical protein HRU28_10235 [Rhizobiales bacterium]|nr:hypothetical protein [Hyphomicrobiales bacterium]
MNDNVFSPTKMAQHHIQYALNELFDYRQEFGELLDEKTIKRLAEVLYDFKRAVIIAEIMLSEASYIIEAKNHD